MTEIMETTGERIRKWLEGVGAQKFLRDMAQRILREARARDLSPSFLGASTWKKEDFDRLGDDIFQELAVLVQEEQVQRVVLTLENRYAGAYLKKVFLNRWVDSCRKKNTSSPWNHLYSRARRVFHEAQGEFFLHQEKNTRVTWFSSAEPSIVCGPLAEEDLKTFPFPPGLADQLVIEKIEGKKPLIALATHFLKEISRRFYGGEPVRVRLNDFVTWIGLYVVLRHRTVEASGAGDREPLDTVVSPGLGPGSAFDPHRIRIWAGMLAERLKPPERQAFYLKWGEDLPLRVIAAKMGYKGESGPKYLIDQAEEKMQDFTRDLEGLSPEGPDEEARSFFKEVLMEFLKKSVMEP